MLSQLRAVIACVILAAATMSAGDSSSDASGLVLRLQAAQDVRLGERINVVVEVGNEHPRNTWFVLHQMLWVPRPFPVSPYFLLSFDVTDAEGRQIEEVSPASDDASEELRVAVFPCNFTPFGPGERFGRTVSLTGGSLHIPISKPGHYRIRASVQAFGRDWLRERRSGEAGSLGPRPDLGFQGTLRSNTVVVSVK